MILLFGIQPGLSLGLVAAYVVQKVDRRYHRLAEEARWFGIKVSRGRLSHECYSKSESTDGRAFMDAKVAEVLCLT